MGKPPTKILVVVLDEHGRTLTKESQHKLISEFCEKAFAAKSVDAVILSGPSINKCEYLAKQIIGRDIAEWELIYLHGSKCPGCKGEQFAERTTSPPVLLANEDKQKLVELLPGFNGTSAEAVYKVLVDSGVFD